MMKKCTNIFIANTPFQIFVIRLIINTYYKDNGFKNIVFATCPIGVSDDIYAIRHGLNSVKDLLFMKNVVKNCLTDDVQFFIPHLSNLVSNYFYNVANKEKKSINVYYEGIAQFYHPNVKIDKRILLKRKFISSICGLGYEARTEFYPEDLTDIATFYTPVPELCIDCKKKETFEFPHKVIVENDNILFLSSNKMDDITKKEALSLIKQMVLANSIVYFKPHYELSDEVIMQLKDNSKSEGINLVLLDKHRNIEQFYDELSFSKVISQEFSSALVNMKLIFQNQVSVRVMKAPSGIGEKLCSFYGFSKDF